MNKKNLIIISPQSGCRLINWAELKKCKDLFYFLVLKNIKVVYKQTVLGIAWAVIQPFFTMIIFSVIFGKMVKVPSDGIPYPIFSFSALIPWTYFSTSLTSASNSLIAEAQVISKIYYPRIIIPIVPVVSKLLDFFISLGFLGLMMWYYGISIPLNILWLPLLLFITMITSAGMGLWFSALGIQYRDVRHFLKFIIQLMMYGAPVVWPVSILPARYRLIAGLYPLVGIIDGFRSVLLGLTKISWDLICIGFMVSMILFVSGVYYFSRMEKRFADVV